MPKVKVYYIAEAVRDYPESGVYQGQGYYWWDRCGKRHKSTHRPLDSEREQDAFAAGIYRAGETIPSTLNCTTMDDLRSLAGLCRVVADDVHSLRGKSTLPGSAGVQSRIVRQLREAAGGIDRLCEEFSRTPADGQKDFDDLKAGVQDQLDSVDWSFE
jgi:hypothetical protein